MPDEEYYDENQQEEEDVGYDDMNVNMSSDVYDELKNMTALKLFKDLAKPDLRQEIRLRTFDETAKQIVDDITFFTKELKVSNLDLKTYYLVVELSDLALYCYVLGAVQTAKNIIAYRDFLLSASSSKNASFLRWMKTDVNVSKIQKASDRRFYRKMLRGIEEEYL